MERIMGVVALAALLAVAWWLVRDEERRGPGLEAHPVFAAPGPATPTKVPDSGDRATLAVPSASEVSSPQPDGWARVPAAAHAEKPAVDELRVRVLDAEGIALASVQVSLEAPLDPGSEGAAGRVRQPTDSQGRVRFAQARERIASDARPWTLSHDVPAAEPPSRVLDHAALEPDEFVSELPPGGRLEVRVRELDGTPAPDGSELRLRLAQSDAREWKLTVVEGEARFPWVELGREWDLAAWRPQGMAPARARVGGPVLPGETVQVELVLGADHPVVSFRAVDPAGRPFASVPLELAHRQRFGGEVRATLETDARGRFLVDGVRIPFGTSTFVLSHLPAEGGLLQGRAKLPEQPRVGWNDGGDIVLEPQPLLCAGSALDPDGRGMAEVDVVAGNDHAWLGDAAQLRGKTGADGRFELRGMWAEEEFDLRAEQGNLRSETIRARQGEEGLVLVLAPRHALSGRLAVDEGIDARAVDFQLQPVDGAPFDVGRRRDRSLDFRAAFRASTLSAPDGFQLEPVPGGTYTLRCSLQGTELARTQPFLLDADLDLGTIDLRGRIQGCEIVLRGAADPAALRGKAVWSASGSRTKHQFDFEGERVRIQTPTLPIDVVLLPQGYRLAHLEAVRERSEIDLEPALRVRIVLWTDGELPEPPFALGCELEQDGRSVGQAQGTDSFDAGNREIAFICSAVGKVQVCWNLERSFEGAGFGGAVGGGVLDGHEVEIDVRDEAAEQVFTVSLEGARLADLMRSTRW